MVRRKEMRCAEGGKWLRERKRRRKRGESDDGEGERDNGEGEREMKGGEETRKKGGER